MHRAQAYHKPLVPYPMWRMAGTLLVPNATTVPGIKTPSPVLLGRRARVWGPIRSGGSVHLAAEAVALGGIRAVGDVIIGARAEVAGVVQAEGTVRVQRGAKVKGEIRALHHVELHDGTEVDAVRANGDIRVHGRVVTGRLKAGGRTVLADD